MKVTVSNFPLPSQKNRKTRICFKIASLCKQLSNKRFKNTVTEYGLRSVLFVNSLDIFFNKKKEKKKMVIYKKCQKLPAY